MALFVDQLGDELELEQPIKRIVSLVPSQTELLAYFELDEKVVGITKFCIHPQEWFETKTRIGGTKSIDIQKVKALSPDLIIGNKEENTFEDIVALREVAPVWMSDINTIDDAIEMIKSLGEICGEKDKSTILIEQIQGNFNDLTKFVKKQFQTPLSALYFIWKNPDYVAGKNTYIDSMLSSCGFVNATSIDRYPEIIDLDLDPDVIFLSTEPFPFKDSDIADYEKRYPKAKVLIVDGEMFSWYGSRLEQSPTYFKKIIKENLLD